MLDDDFFFCCHLIFVFLWHPFFLFVLTSIKLWDIIQVFVCVRFLVFNIILQLFYYIISTIRLPRFSFNDCSILRRYLAILIRWSPMIFTFIIQFLSTSSWCIQLTFLFLHFSLLFLPCFLFLCFFGLILLFLRLFFFLRRWLLRQIILLLKILYPWMIKNLNQRQPFICFVYKYLVDKVLVLIRKTWFESDLSSHDLVADFSRMNTSKRCSSMDKFVK